MRDKLLPTALVIVLAMLAFLVYWQTCTKDTTSVIVVYFGRPRDMFTYFTDEWRHLACSAANCMLTAVISLIFAGLLSLGFLALGLRFAGGLALVERLAAVSQAIPVLIIVTLLLIIERSIFDALGIKPPATVYCIGPVTVGLLFPPLVYGAEAVLRLPVEIKALLRLWRVPHGLRINHIYLPAALPGILTGVRASATWAVGATLVAEGLINGVPGDITTLGHDLIHPFSSVVPGRTPAVISLATVLGFAVYYVFDCLQNWLERRLLGAVAEAEQAYPL